MSGDIIWQATLDDRYTCTVERLGRSCGRLIIRDGEIELFAEGVMLHYEARFGPDVADVESWMGKCEEFIDGREEE
jgi:hypothetical protein